MAFKKMMRATAKLHKRNHAFHGAAKAHQPTNGRVRQGGFTIAKHALLLNVFACKNTPCYYANCTPPTHLAIVVIPARLYTTAHLADALFVYTFPLLERAT